MQGPRAQRIRWKRRPDRPVGAIDTTIYPIAMIVVLTIVLVLMMVLVARR